MNLLRMFGDEPKEATIRFIKSVAKLLMPGEAISNLDKIANDIYMLNFNISQVDHHAVAVVVVFLVVVVVVMVVVVVVVVIIVVMIVVVVVVVVVVVSKTQYTVAQ